MGNTWHDWGLIASCNIVKNYEFLKKSQIGERLSTAGTCTAIVYVDRALWCQCKVWGVVHYLSSWMRGRRCIWWSTTFQQYTPVFAWWFIQIWFRIIIISIGCLQMKQGVEAQGNISKQGVNWGSGWLIILHTRRSMATEYTNTDRYIAYKKKYGNWIYKYTCLNERLTVRPQFTLKRYGTLNVAEGLSLNDSKTH